MSAKTIACAALVLAIAAGCSDDDPASAPSPVAVLGDSLALQAAGAIDAALAPAQVTNDSAIGRRMDQALAAAQAISDAAPAAVVIVLGTNDARRGITDDDLAEADAIAAALDAIECRVWVAVTTTTGDRAFDRGATRLNEHLRAMGEVIVAPWDERTDGSGARVADDEIHLTEAGRRDLASTIAHAHAQC